MHRRDLTRLEGGGAAGLASRSWAPDCIAVRRQTDLQGPTRNDFLDDTPLVALGAARLKETRLIDYLEISSQPH